MDCNNRIIAFSIVVGCKELWHVRILFPFRVKPSNVAYKHPSLVPRENDVREHKLFVGKSVSVSYR